MGLGEIEQTEPAGHRGTTDLVSEVKCCLVATR
jgi:hypothetical protein